MFGMFNKLKPTIVFINYFFSTLWVKSINNAVEECQAAEKSTLAEKAAFSVAGRFELFIIE